MASLPILTVVERCQISPPPATVADISLPLTFFDIQYLRRPPIHFLFFYELPLTTTHFIETIVPTLKHSLSTTLQHFPPYTGNLFLFPTSKQIPEIRYLEGDSVEVTFAECNLDFNYLTGFHPRKCDKFHHLVPVLGPYSKSCDFVKVPVFSLQVTFFPNHGVSIGITFHHSLVDASSQLCFLKAWTSIYRCGTDESFLANGTLPIYERLVKYPKLDESFLNSANVETLDEVPQHVSGSPDKVRATFVLTRTFIDRLKKHVSTELPEIPHLSSFTVTCAFTWCCIAKARQDDLEVFVVPVDCRARLEPPIPAAYFGNCIGASTSMAKTTALTGKEGLITAAKLIGENLHKTLSDKEGIVKDRDTKGGSFPQGVSIAMIAIAGTPKIKLYELDFGWGKPKKLERVSLDYGQSIAMDAGRECEQDVEIGVCLTATQMEVFGRVFNQGLEPYI